LRRVAAVFDDDPALVAAADRIGSRLAELPRDSARFGTIHGDFELDNLGWDGDVAVAYDFDEAARSWFVADIASAVRDLTTDGVLLAAFLAGYRRERPLPEQELAPLPLFAAAHAACAAVRARSALDAVRPDEPAWLGALRAKLERFIRRQRDLAVQSAS
jgi:Ser/Thr protein kinase RdoA (MazF antagonist)